MVVKETFPEILPEMTRYKFACKIRMPQLEKALAQKWGPNTAKNK